MSPDTGTTGSEYISLCGDCDNNLRLSMIKGVDDPMRWLMLVADMMP